MMKSRSKHPMKGLLSKDGEALMVQVIEANKDRLHWAMRDTIKTDAYTNPLGAAQFMSGVAAGIMVAIHFLEEQSGDSPSG